MKEKVLNIFYGNDCRPYKDKERAVEFPIVGNDFVGANETTQLRFYLDRIGGCVNVTWVLLAKLPDNTIVSQILNNKANDYIIGEQYLKFDLSILYTYLKGDVFISLNGYQGNIQVETDQETGLSTILGTPAIRVTGAFKFSINYSPLMPQQRPIGISEIQQIITALSGKPNVLDVIVCCETEPEDLSGFEDGQIFYFKDERKFYLLDNGELIFYAIISPEGSGLVPYNGANDNVNLGEFGIKAKMFQTKNEFLKITENYGETDAEIQVKKNIGGNNTHTTKWAFYDESSDSVHFASREWVSAHFNELLEYATDEEIDEMFEEEPEPEENEEE